MRLSILQDEAGIKPTTCRPIDPQSPHFSCNKLNTCLPCRHRFYSYHFTELPVYKHHSWPCLHVEDTGTHCDTSCLQLSLTVDHTRKHTFIGRLQATFIKEATPLRFNTFQLTGYEWVLSKIRRQKSTLYHVLTMQVLRHIVMRTFDSSTKQFGLIKRLFGSC